MSEDNTKQYLQEEDLEGASPEEKQRRIDKHQTRVFDQNELKLEDQVVDTEEQSLGIPSVQTEAQVLSDYVTDGRTLESSQFATSKLPNESNQPTSRYSKSRFPEVKFSMEECNANLGNFVLRGKLIRDTVLKQSLFMLGRIALIKRAILDNKLPDQEAPPKNFFSMIPMINLSSINTKSDDINKTEEDQSQENIKNLQSNLAEPKDKSQNLENPSAVNKNNNSNPVKIEDQKIQNVVKVGIIGAGVMGKMQYYTFKGKTLHGMKLDVSMSTRVPERFFKETLVGEKIFRDNEKITNDNDIIFICVPKHKCNAVFSQIKTIFHRRNNEDAKRRVLIFSIVGNLNQAKLDTYLSCEKDSQALTTCLDYNKIEETIEKVTQEQSESSQALNLSKASDDLSFDCFYNETYINKIYQVLNTFGSKKKMLASNPVFKGIIQFLNNQTNPLDNHFYRDNMKNAALQYIPSNEDKEAVAPKEIPKKVVFQDDFSKFIMGFASDQFLTKENIVKSNEIFTETICSIRKDQEKVFEQRVNN